MTPLFKNIELNCSKVFIKKALHFLTYVFLIATRIKSQPKPPQSGDFQSLHIKAKVNNEK